MSSQETGGPAFPLAIGWIETDMSTGHQTVVDVRDLDRGMTLRDRFAEKAMEKFNGVDITCDSDIKRRFDFSDAASLCYQYADAMLKERAK